MTKLLQQVIAEIEKLPEDAQDAIAARLLADLADEKEWAARFAVTTDAQWDRMAAMVRREIAAGDTIENVDWETVSLSTHPQFLALIERSRLRQRAEGGISSAEMRRRLGLN